MGMNKPVETAGSSETNLLSEYHLLEECILSGQIEPAHVEVLMQKDLLFANWLRARAASRLRSK
jgi:hypothetical protein